MAKKAEIINVTFNDDNTITVTYSTGTIRPYKSISALPSTALAWLEAHKEPDPELKKIQDSMTESFYEYCTVEPAPESWKEIVAEEKGERVSSQVSPKDLPSVSQSVSPVPTKSSPSATEAVGFGICMALAYTARIAKGAAELLILALQVLYITITPVVLRASERLWDAWLRIYPEIVPTACKTARIAAKQAAMVVWWL